MCESVKTLYNDFSPFNIWSYNIEFDLIAISDPSSGTTNLPSISLMHSTLIKYMQSPQ